MLSLWVYDSQEEKFEKITDPTLIKLNACLQELSLWQGENPMDINSGIDYKGVREMRVFLKKAIEDIVEKYLVFFDFINVGDLVREGDSISCDINFIKDNKPYNITLESNL